MIYYENNNGTRMDLDNWPVVIEDITARHNAKGTTLKG